MLSNKVITSAVVARCVLRNSSRPFSEIAKEVNRVMANPEINGNPVPLDFSKGKSATGFSRTGYADSYDRIFGSKKEKVVSGREAGTATVVKQSDTAS